MNGEKLPRDFYARDTRVVARALQLRLAVAGVGLAERLLQRVARLLELLAGLLQLGTRVGLRRGVAA